MYREIGYSDLEHKAYTRCVFRCLAMIFAVMGSPLTGVAGQIQRQWKVSDGGTED